MGMELAISSKMVKVFSLVVLDLKEEGCWDSMHLVAVTLETKKVKYRVATGINFGISQNNQTEKVELDISGTFARTVRLVFILLD